VFLQLHCRRHYSFLRVLAPPHEIDAAEVDQQMRAVALTDSNGRYADVSLYQAAKTAGIKPIAGVALVAAADGDKEIPRLWTTINHRPSARNGSFKAVSLVLLAVDMQDYSTLRRLVTLQRLSTTNPKWNIAAPETDGRQAALQELAEHNIGVITMCPLPSRFCESGNPGSVIYRAPKTTAPAGAYCR
jgi:DNA polymerase III alpha subunit